MSKEIDYIGEGPTDDAMARKLIEAVEATPGRTRRNPMRGNGKASLDARIAGLNAGIEFGGKPILLLRDLDRDAPCASLLVGKLVKSPHPNLFLRICVTAAESWLMADAKDYASFCGVAIGKIPAQTDIVANPKSVVISWRNHSSKLKRHFDTAEKLGLPQWATVAQWNIEFIERRWNPRRAAHTGRSSSLIRAMNRLEIFAAQ